MKNRSLLAVTPALLAANFSLSSVDDIRFQESNNYISQEEIVSFLRDDDQQSISLAKTQKEDTNDVLSFLREEKLIEENLNASLGLDDRKVFSECGEEEGPGPLIQYGGEDSTCNEGTLTVAYDGTQNRPDFVNMPNGTIEIELLTNGTTTQYGKLTGGNIELVEDSTIHVNVLSSSTNVSLLAGQTFTDVIDATSYSWGSLIIHGPINITDNSDLVDFTYTKDGDTIDLKAVIVPVITASDVNFTIDEDTSKTFSVNDFSYSGNGTLSHIIITALSSAGSLKLNSTDVTLNQEIAVADIPNLVFTPVADAFGTPYTTFGFKVKDENGISTDAYTATINVTAVAETSPSISPTISAGTEDSAIKITYTPSSGNSLKYMFSNSSVAIPTEDTTLPIEVLSYVSGTNITNAVAGKYLIVYEVDGSGAIVGFYQKELESTDIYVADNTTTPTTPTIIPKLINIIPDQLIDVNNTAEFDLNISTYFTNATQYSFSEIKADNNITDWLQMSDGVFDVNTDDNSSLLGTYFIQATGSNEDTNTSGYFTLRVKDLNAGLSTYIDKPNDATQTQGDDFLSFTKNDSNATVYNDGSAKHIISGIVEATSLLPDSKVKIEENGDVNTTTSTINDSGQIVNIEVVGKVTGDIKAEHTLRLDDGNITKAISKLNNTFTTIKTDRTVETNTTINTHQASVVANPDGTAKHTLSVGSFISSVISKIKGATTTLSEDGVDTQVNYNSIAYLISTDKDGETIPKKGGVEIIDTTGGDKLSVGSTVTINTNGTMEINTTIPSNGLLKIKEGN